MNRRSILAGAGLAALVTTAKAKTTISSKLPELIASHQLAHQAFSKCCDRQWDKEWERLSDAEEEALLAILCHRPTSPADARAKVNYLGELSKGGLPDWSFDALLESLLPEGEKLPDTFTKWDLHHVGGAK